MRKRGVLLSVLLVICLAIAVLHGTSTDREVQSHLKRLEYWQRVQFGGKSTWRDLKAAASSRLRGASWDPQQEAQKEIVSLIALGYLVRHSFVLSAPLTNRAENISLVQTVRNAKFPDSHWSFTQFSNRIDAVICASDVPHWERVIRTWDTQRVSRRQP